MKTGSHERTNAVTSPGASSLACSSATATATSGAGSCVAIVDVAGVALSTAEEGSS